MTDRETEFTPVRPQVAALIASAAKGSEQAQSGLLDLLLSHAATCEKEKVIALNVAELAARLAAAHGSAHHRRRLADLLVQMAADALEREDHAASGCVVEAMAILNELADEGDEEAAQYLLNLASVVSSDLVAAARKMRRATLEPGSDLGSDVTTYWTCPV